jgi:predicted transcriptional regulator
MARPHDYDLSRRERQIMDVLYARPESSVEEIVAALPDPPTSTAVRTLLRILEGKGHVKRRKDGRRHLYRPSRSRESAARSALRRVLGLFFDNSMANAMAEYFADPKARIDDAELERLRRLIDETKKGSR